jgi:multisubunit Na+/H+ antiporter MnhG subunit
VNTCQPLHGSVFALIGATGLLRMKDVFQHMQPPALASTLGALVCCWQVRRCFASAWPVMTCPLKSAAAAEL